MGLSSERHDCVAEVWQRGARRQWPLEPAGEVLSPVPQPMGLRQLVPQRAVAQWGPRRARV